MVEPKKHIQDITPYTVDDEIEWDLKLDFNENLIGPSPKVLKAIKTVNPNKIKFYPAYTELIKAIAKYSNVDIDNIIAVNGTDEGYRYIFDAYCSFGDNVLNVNPSFSMPQIYAQISNCNYIEVPYQKRWEFPIEEFLERINSSIKLVIITSPNSPTGDLISDENLVKIIKKAENSLVIIDETYAGFADKTYIDYAKKYNNVLVLKSMSKDFATAGLRLGYLISNTEVINNIKRIASPYNVNSLAALAGKVALTDLKHIEKVKKEIQKSKEYLLKELKTFAKEIYPAFGNFLCVDFGIGAKYIYKKLLNNNIKVKLLSGVAENCFRITIPPLKDAKKLIKVLKKQKMLIVFDMDGVLVDASKSYRVAIQKTFEFYAKKEVSLERIQELKNQGGYNNDWILTKKLLDDENVKVSYENVVKKFDEFYFGVDGNGLIENEKWLISKDILEKLSKKYDLAIFTGRTKREAEYAFKNANINNIFEPIITSDLLEENEQKPSPKGLNIIKEIVKPKKCYYLGDTKDDITAGKLANYQTIGVLPPQDKTDFLKSILKNEGAFYVLNDVNDLIKILEK